MSFVLILTVLSLRGVAVTPVYGFDTLQACQAAGDAWLRDIRALPASGVYQQPSARCVPVSQPQRTTTRP